MTFQRRAIVTGKAFQIAVCVEQKHGMRIADINQKRAASRMQDYPRRIVNRARQRYLLPAKARLSHSHINRAVRVHPTDQKPPSVSIVLCALPSRSASQAATARVPLPQACASLPSALKICMKISPASARRLDDKVALVAALGDGVVAPAAHSIGRQGRHSGAHQG